MGIEEILHEFTKAHWFKRGRFILYNQYRSFACHAQYL